MSRLTILFLFFAAACQGLFGGDNLDSLDRLIQERHTYEIAHRQKIDRSQAEYLLSADDNSRYNALRGLYENYRSFKVDSALIIAAQRLEVARRLGEPAKIASATLNTAEAYLRSGAYEKALSILDTLNRDYLTEHHYKYLNSVLRGAYTLKAENSLLADDRLKALEENRRLRDNLMQNVSPDSRTYYTLNAERLREAGFIEEAVKTIEQANTLYDFSGDAVQQYVMGEIYAAYGQKDKAIEHLTKSAIIDLSNGTKEYRSLILLATILFEEGQIERAFNYINCAFEDAEFSKAAIRTAEIMKTMPLIDKAYSKKQREGEKTTRTFLIVVSALSLLLLVLLLITARYYNQKRKMVSTIETINNELKEKNVLLSQNDNLKLQYINILMMANAKHISRLRDFRRKIYRLIKAAQYDKAMESVTGDRAETQDISSFHEMFDEAFLKMFPDFLDRINSIFKTPVTLKTAGRFTPELRVLAMMKLGMNSTEEISAMFHYSQQTVYNIRTSIRNMIKVSWSELETFLSSI